MNAFPILSLDAELLSPALGYSFDRRWVHRHESLLSLLWKFMAVNGAPAHLVVRYLDPLADPYWGIEPIRVFSLYKAAARLLGVNKNVTARALLTPAAYAVASPYFRYCTRCAHRGFHSVLFQLPRVMTCPIHNVALIEHCTKCKKPLPHTLSVRTLEHPYRCPHCGRKLCNALLNRLEAIKQPNDKCVQEFEDAYRRFGHALLGYPGHRRNKPYTPRFIPKEELAALKLEHIEHQKRWYTDAAKFT
jgi:hypothetical protein